MWEEGAWLHYLHMIAQTIGLGNRDFRLWGQPKAFVLGTTNPTYSCYRWRNRPTQGKWFFPVTEPVKSIFWIRIKPSWLLVLSSFHWFWMVDLEVTWKGRPNGTCACSLTALAPSSEDTRSLQLQFTRLKWCANKKQVTMHHDTLLSSPLST